MQTANLLKARNYDQNLSDLSSCDLIIEAIAERLDWKEDLYKKIVPAMATVMPAAAIRLPLRAVAGFDNIFKPIMNVTAPTR